MISVGSGDGRKGLGLGFGVGREMEETELEEGEACSFQNDDDSTIDPDVALSYIDEKLQDVLGHFQKDFEGGVSAENLGAKFGGYGSFLPTYQRSPVWSHPRTPTKFHNNTTAKSPNNYHLEGGRWDPVVPSHTALPGRPGPASVSAVSLPPVRAASANDTAKQESCISSACAEESTSKSELVNNSMNYSDHKTLKVRIKVGSDNLMTRKNAEIYSGLGLDVSPSSSMEDSPSDSEGLSREPQDVPFESPNSILQIMTSFPVQGCLLLSPLPDDIICLTEKEKLQRERKSGYRLKGYQENSKMLVDDSDYASNVGKVLGDNKLKSSEKDLSSLNMKNGHCKNAHSGMDALKKETDIDSAACEELVSNALKLPLLINCDVVDSSNETAKKVNDTFKVAQNFSEKDEPVYNTAKEEPLEALSAQDNFRGEKLNNGKAGSAGMDWEDKKASAHDNFPIYPRKDGNFKGEKNDVLGNADLYSSKVRKASKSDRKDLVKQKASEKATSLEEDGIKLAPGKEHSSSGSKKKSKGSQSRSIHGADPRDSLSGDSSLVRKNKKSSLATNILSTNEVDDLKMQKNSGQAKDRYREFFGDMELEPGGNDIDPVDMLSADRLKESEVVEKKTSSSNSSLKEKSIDRKNFKPSAMNTYPKVASNMAPNPGNGPVSDAAPGTAAPVVQEDWVCCDKCQKWRLLPYGTNPDSLPEKWLCSMLNWLPGMNRCSISEEETTKALTALYQIPAPVGQNNNHGYPGGIMSGITSVGRSFNQSHQDLDTCAVASGGKKKQGIKEAFNASQDGLPQYPNSMKKNLQSSVKSRSLNGMNQSPSVIDHDLQHVTPSRSTVSEKHRSKQKEKKVLEQYSDGGCNKNSKMKSKRESDQDDFRASKKIKIDSKRQTDEDHVSDHSGVGRKLGPSTSSVLSINASRDQHKYNDHSSTMELKCDAKNSLQAPARNLKDQGLVASDDGSMHMGRSDDKDIVARKRKVTEGQGSQNHVGLVNTANHLQDSRDFVEETSENDHKTEKKARVSKREGSEASGRKGSGGAARNDRGLKDQQLEPDVEFNLSQRELGSLQPSVAATSSSSKVSGSRKNKSNYHEAKGSPVESVSSSPLRVVNPNKSTTSRKDLAGKVDLRTTGSLAGGTPRRCSDGEDDGGSSRSGTIKKEDTVTHHGSVESSVLDFQDRDTGHLSISKSKIQPKLSPEFARSHLSNGGTETFGQETQYSCKPQTSEQRRDEERGIDHQHNANVSRSKKSSKGSSSRSKEKSGHSKPEFDKGKIKIFNSSNESVDHTPYEEKSRAEKNKPEDKSGLNSDKVEKMVVGKKDSTGKPTECSKRESQSKSGGLNGVNIKMDSTSSQDLLQDDVERSSKRVPSDKTDRDESGRGKSHRLPPSGRVHNDTGSSCPQPIPGSQKENGPNSCPVDVSEGEEAVKVAKQIKKGENQNGNHPTNSRHPTPFGRKVRDSDAPSPVRRDSSSQAATNALKEAKDLKHLADRIKNSGSTQESTGLYFEAALKFLHGASLLESGISEGAKLGEAGQSKQIYSSTAKLCEFCAHEYEKSKDMAAAALAYKCMEVAYMRVIYCSHSGASRDRHELQAALQIVPPGESPSSSASDVDNLNNPATTEKGAFAKGISSPQVAGNHVIAARNRNSFVRLLNFVQEVTLAMEASRKSRIAFEAANTRLEDARYREGIASVKSALDFNFQDVEVLLRWVKLAKEAITR